MQKLFSFKSLSKPSKRLPIAPFLHSNLAQNSISFTSRNSNQLNVSPFLQSHSVSHLCCNSFRSWRTTNGYSQRFSGIFKKPIFANHIISNTYMSLPRGSFFDCGIRFMRDRFQRLQFEFGRPFQVQRNYWRLRIPTGEVVVWGLIAANVAVFILWRIADPIFMMKNFMISLDNFTSGRIHTLITSAFSHIEAWHLFSNMFGLYFFGTSISQLFGPEFLLKLYLAGAIGGSVFFLVHKAISSSNDAKYVRGLDAKYVRGLDLLQSRPPTDAEHSVYVGGKWCCERDCTTSYFSVSKGHTLLQFLHTSSSDIVGSNFHWKRCIGYDGAKQSYLRRSSLGGCCGCCPCMGKD